MRQIGRIGKGLQRDTLQLSHQISKTKNLKAAREKSLFNCHIHGIPIRLLVHFSEETL